MYVKHLQEYLDKFTEGQQGRRGNAVSDAKIYIMTKKGYLEEIKRIEVHQSNNPMDTSLRVVLKPNREEKLILPPGYIKDYQHLNTGVTLKNAWHQSVNFIKKLRERSVIFPLLDLKIIAYMALLIYWSAMILATFSLSN